MSDISAMGAFSPPLWLTGRLLDAWSARWDPERKEEEDSQLPAIQPAEPAGTEPARDPGESLWPERHRAAGSRRTAQ
jgi:hypothetical protein